MTRSRALAAALEPWLAATRELLRGTQPVFVAFVASRLLIFGIIGLSMLIVRPGYYSDAGGPLRVLTRWDGGWYLEIARNGYQFSAAQQSSMGFFPFYPILVKLASFVFRDFALAAVLVSNVCFLAAGLLLQALIKIDYKDSRISNAAVMFLMFSPVSFFFSSAYTESTFLMLVLAAFLAARKQKWLLACILGMLVSATRNVGFWIAVPLFLEYLRHIWAPGFTLRALFHPRILLFGLVPLGFVFFMLYGYIRFENFFAFLQATAVWGRSFTSPLNTFATLPTNPRFHQWLFVLVLTGGVCLWAAGFFFKIRASYLVYAGLLIGTYVCSNTLEAIPRSLSVVFPLFLVMGLLAARFDWMRETLLAASVAILTICTVLTANGFWMT